MVKYEVSIATRAHDYGSSQPIIGPEPPPMEKTLHIDKLEPLPCISKGALNLSTHSPNSRVTQNYSIFEDLGQTSCAMLALEVLHTCPTQRNSLLSTLGALDLSGSKVINLDVVDVNPRLAY
jgi:hypothetical protein